jgi:hypothetical protein
VTFKPEQHREIQPREPFRGSRCYWSAAAVAALALSALFVWPTVDASYRFARYVAKVDLRLERITAADPAADSAGITDTMMSRANRWGQLGSRVELLYLLYSVAFAATVVMLIYCVRAKSIGRFTALLGIVVCWLVLFSSHSQVEHWSARQQASRILPQIETAAAALTAHWPTKNGHVAPDLDVLVDTHRNVLIVVGRKSYPIREDFGYLIERSANGTLRFSLSGAFDCNVEFHPTGSRPGAYVNGYGNPLEATEITRLKEHWYLVRYGNG